MEYDQGYHNAPQRPYNGRAAQPPAAHYAQSPQQHYAPQQQYDQYPQDNGYHDGYDQGGYGQEQYPEQYQQPMNGGGRKNGGGQHYQQPQDYSQQQEHYGNGGQRGGHRAAAPVRPTPQQSSREPPSGRGGGPPRPVRQNTMDRQDGRSPASASPQAPPQLRAPVNGAPPGKSQRPNQPHPDQKIPTDPGSKLKQQTGGILAPPQKSPEISWDGPFPSFRPAPKKATPPTSPEKLQKGMADMNIRGGPPTNDPNHPRHAPGRHSEDSQRRPHERAPPGDNYGRPSLDSSRAPPQGRGYPPQQQQQPPPPQNFSKPPPMRAPGNEAYARPPQDGQRNPQNFNGPPARAPSVDDYGRPSQDGQRNPQIFNSPPPRAPTADGYGRPSQDRQRPPQNLSSPPPRAPTADGYGRPSLDSHRPVPQQQPPQNFNTPLPARAPSVDTYGRPSLDGQRGGRGTPGGYSSPVTAPGNYGGFDDASQGRPHMNSGSRNNSDGLTRSATFTQNMDNGMDMQDTGPSAPYNGPIGRSMPPRPATASGTRAPPQRNFPPARGPAQSVQPMQTIPAVKPEAELMLPVPAPSDSVRESVSDFYDAYYYPPPAMGNARPGSAGSDMPDFDNVKPKPPMPVQFEPPVMMQQNGYGPMQKTKSQPDIRGRVEAQSAEIYEMSGDIPQFPQEMAGGYHPNGMAGDMGQMDGYNAGPGYGQDPYAHQNSYYGNGMPPQNGQRGPPPSQNYNAQDVPRPAPGKFPPRSQSSMGHRPGPQGMGMGLPNGPSPMGNGMPGSLSRTNTLPNGPQQYPPQGPPLSGEALPSHPAPVRPGLMNNAPPPLPNNHPAPVRQYNGVGPAGTPAPAPVQAAPSPVKAAPVAAAAPVTAQELESLRMSVKTRPNDFNNQLVLARKLIEASDVLVATIPDQKARTKARERYIFDAHKILKKLAAAQHTDSMFFLADCYGRGALGLEPDNKEAFTLYQGAAKAGHAAAAYRTAVCCELGSDEGGGTRKDPLKAIQWYKRAAALGDTPAMYKMGMIQLKGLLGQPRNPREAIGWLKRAAEVADAENPHALHELGLLYESASGNDAIVRDEAYSFSLFMQAANLGYKFSQFRLGCAYEYGLFNLPISPRDSIMWYSRAAVQEEHQSELALSGWYLTGSEGVLQQSDTEAYLWARKAAVAGLAKAEYAMGYFTEVGIGAPANLEDAKRWYWRAAAQNFPKARERLEDLKKGGNKPVPKARERISRSQKHAEGECAVM